MEATVPDTATHGTVWWVPIAINAAAFHSTGVTPFEHNEMVAFAIGAILPDVLSEPPAWFAMLRHMGKLHLRYSKETTLIYKKIARRGIFRMWIYKFFHSLLGMATVTSLTALLWGEQIAVALAFGYIVHILLDFFSHRRYWPLLPWGRPFRTRQKGWWEWKIYVDHYWKIIAFSALIDGVGIGYLFL